MIGVQVRRDLRSIKRRVVATHHDGCKANLMANIQMEELIDEKDVGHLEHMEGREVVTMADDFLEGEPIFLLEREKACRIRVGLTHKHPGDAASFKICAVSAKPADGNLKTLDIIGTREPSEGSEIIALFRTDWFPSSRLSVGCPLSGSVEEKYVKVAVTICVDIAANRNESGREDLIEITGTMWCLPVSERNPIKHVRQFTRFAGTRWKNAPQWIRDAARGATILTTVCLNTAARADPSAGQVLFWWNVLGRIAKFFTLPCFRIQNA